MKNLLKNHGKKEILTEFSENAVTRISSTRKGLIIGAAGLALLIGIVFIVAQGTGYDVYYGEKKLGFVSSPGEVMDNIANINSTISEKIDAEANVDESEFNFSKDVKLFSSKDQWADIAEQAGDKCDIDVNIYDIYVDGEHIATDSSIDGAVNAMTQIKDEYTEKNPSDKYDTIDFAETVEIDVTKGQDAEFTDEEEIYKAMNDCLTVQTFSRVESEETAEYETEYETTDTLDVGATKVKQAGKNGLVKIVTEIEKRDGKVVNQVPSKKIVIEEVQNQIVLVGIRGLKANDSGFVSPTKGMLTSRMGTRWGRTHKGIDIAGTLGTPVYAARAGTVITAQYKDNGYGNMVEIDHGDGLVTLYAHLNSIECQVGDEVIPGLLIGTMGSTGRSTGVHLHFEVMQDGINLDPLIFVEY